MEHHVVTQRAPRGMSSSPSDRESHENPLQAQTREPQQPQQQQAQSLDTINDPQQLRAELERLRQREAQIMSLIGCKNPDKILHDLRNLLNEVQLLRVLADVDKA
jgi:hypothetical protein